jgi:hypothetical protein
VLGCRFKTQLVSVRLCCITPFLLCVKYNAIIELISEVVALSVQHMIFHLDSQLAMSQLNNVYCVHNPMLLQKYLQVRLLDRTSESITYVYIPRRFNEFIDSLSNTILNSQMSH